MKTDSQARIISAEATDLQYKGGKRDYYRKDTPGKETGDHSGHLIGDIFGGSGNYDNLISMKGRVNLSDFKKLENKWKRALDAKERVYVKITLDYIGNEIRPDSFLITYSIGEKALIKKVIFNK